MNADKGNFQHIAYAFKTDVGKKRKNNEDALGAFPEGGIFCVADGMGGGDDGEIASAAVVKAVDDVSLRCATGAGHAVKDVVAALEAGLSEASSWIWKRASSQKMSVCGSTFVGVVFDSTAPAKAMALHAGDSRLYLIHGKSVKQITRDHSASEMMGEKDESKVNPLFRSMIVNAVGIRRVVDCERTPFRVSAGDRVLVCSDGLYRMVADKQIGEISAANADVEKAVDALVAAALAAGGVDNVSVVLCEIGKLPKPLAATPVPACAPEGAARTRTRGVDADSEASDADATRETIVPVFGDRPDETDEPVAAGVAAQDVPPSPAGRPKRRKSPWMFGLLALAAVMLAAAGAVLLLNRQPVTGTEPPVGKDARPLTAAEATPNGDAPMREKGPVCAVPPKAATNASARPVSVSATKRPEVMTNAPAAAAAVPKPPKPKEPIRAVDVCKVAERPAAKAVEPAVTNKPAVAVPVSQPSLPKAQAPAVGAHKAENAVVAKPAGQAGTNTPAPKVEATTSEAFVAACDARAVSDFASVFRRLLGTSENPREYDDQIRRFRDSARQCARMKSGKYVFNAVIDLKYVLETAGSVKDRIESANADELTCKYADDWVLVAAGSEKDVRVQEACARLIVNAPQLKIQ